LQKNFQVDFNKTLKDDEERIKTMIENNKPSKISFNELQTYYDKCMNVKGADSTRKRRLITSELRKVEQKTLLVLKEFKK
jgi:hypothetical protein